MMNRPEYGKVESLIKTLKRDGIEIIRGTDNEIFEWLLEHTPFSADWACKHEGYSIE